MADTEVMAARWVECKTCALDDECVDEPMDDGCVAEAS
jgi:hypothetical protein